MTDTRTPAERLEDAVNDLDQFRDRRVWLEYYDPIQKRRIRRPHHVGRFSLIELLERDADSDDDTGPKTPGGLAGGFESRPPGHYAPRELLAGLENELALWCDWVGVDRGNTPAQHLRRLHQVAPKVATWCEDDYLAMIRNIEVWASRLKQYAGIESVHRPRATCPHCDKLGTLTVWINTATRTAERAACSACRTTWTTATVGLLLEHIRRGSAYVPPAPTGRAAKKKPPAPVRRPDPNACPRCWYGAEPAGPDRFRCEPCDLNLTRAKNGALIPTGAPAHA